MELPNSEHSSSRESSVSWHPVVRFLIIGPVTGALVGYAQATVAVIVWVLHGEPDFYFRGGEGVVTTYLALMMGGGAVGVAYGAVLSGFEYVTRRRIQPIVSLGLVLVLASCIATVVTVVDFQEREIRWIFEQQAATVVSGLLVSMAVSRRSQMNQRTGRAPASSATAPGKTLR